MEDYNHLMPTKTQEASKSGRPYASNRQALLVHQRVAEPTLSGQAIHTGPSRTNIMYPTEPLREEIPNIPPGPSQSEPLLKSINTRTDTRFSAWLQWLMVLIVLFATVYMALVNNKPDIIFNLCTLCFGYYFGSAVSNPPPSR